MSQEKIEKYFAKKGIKVIFNTLGHTPNLVHSFVSDYRGVVDKSKSKKSEHVKIATYSDMYTFEVRPKLTGFESLKHKDQKFRQNIQKYITESQFSPSLLIDNIELNKTKSYKVLLSESLEKIENPLLYLSGGMDSQLVANAFLEKNIKFKTVVFEYVDNIGNPKNFDDITSAYKFCRRNGIIPEIVQINIDRLWDSEEFKKLAIDTQYTSPQLVTYAYMVELIAEKYPDVTHLFGGEVKFRTNYDKENGEIANVILLEKIVPAYNGQIYSNGGGCGDATTQSLYYYPDGTWAVIFTILLQELNDQVIATGNWYNPIPPPSPFGYKTRVTDILSITENNGGYVAQNTFVNLFDYPGGVLIAGGSAIGAGFGQGNSGGLECEIETKETNNPNSGVFSTIGLYAYSLCF